MLIIRKASIIISSHNYAEQTLTTLHSNTTLSQEQQFTPIRKAVHTSPFIYLIVDSPHNCLLGMVKCVIYSFIYNAQIIL